MKIDYLFVQLLGESIKWVIIAIVLVGAVIALAILLSAFLRDRALYNIAEQIIRAILYEKVARETEMVVEEYRRQPTEMRPTPPVEPYQLLQAQQYMPTAEFTPIELPQQIPQERQVVKMYVQEKPTVQEEVKMRETGVTVEEGEFKKEERKSLEVDERRDFTGT